MAIERAEEEWAHVTRKTAGSAGAVQVRRLRRSGRPWRDAAGQRAVQAGWPQTARKGSKGPWQRLPSWLACGRRFAQGMAAAMLCGNPCYNPCILSMPVLMPVPMPTTVLN